MTAASPLAQLTFQASPATPFEARCVVRKQSDQLFFVYTAAHGGLTVNPLDFFRITRLLERNVAIFQDARRPLYAAADAPEEASFEGHVRWQREYRASLPHVRRLYCLGTCLGGFAALLYGHLLEAEEVWAFGPLTRLVSDEGAKGPRAPAERADLSTALGTYNGRTRYNVFYNESQKVDESAARHIAGCGGVSLWPQTGEGHHVARTMLEQGMLETLLPPPR